MNLFGKEKMDSVKPAQAAGKEPFRFRLYYRLMDLVLLIYAFAILFTIVGEAIALEPEELPAVVFYGVPLLLWPVFYVVVPVLIVARSLRDEYADLLWKRTIAQLMMLTAVIPPLLFASIWFISIVILGGDVANWDGYRPDWLLDPIMKEVYRLGTIMEFWQVFTLGFVFLFQFNRWRDSRAASE